jgi:hypothetical protein
MNLLNREIRRKDRQIELQPMEFSLLEYLMRNVGRVVSKTMIMNMYGITVSIHKPMWSKQGYAGFVTKLTGISIEN